MPAPGAILPVSRCGMLRAPGPQIWAQERRIAEDLVQPSAIAPASARGSQSPSRTIVENVGEHHSPLMAHALAVLSRVSSSSSGLSSS
jgi:hypothetical protein